MAVPAPAWQRFVPGNPKVRRALPVVLVVLVAAALFGPAWLLGPKVEVHTAARRDLVQSVVASGHVEAPHRVQIGAQIIGVVKAVPVAEGQAVKAAQVLVQLDDTELSAALQQAEVAVQQAQARLRQLREVERPVAEQALRQAEVNLDNARRQAQRQQDLYKQGFIGQAALDDARKAVELADAQRRTAHAQLDAARPAGSDIAVAEAALAQARTSADAARARLAYTTLRAPADGVLIARNVEPGDVVQPGKDLMVLSPSGATQLVVQIDEKNLGLLALGQPAQASADAYANQRFAARVDYINPGVDAQRGSVEVKLEVPAPPAYLRQDMTVSVDIEVARHPQALVVSADAVHEAEGRSPWVLKVDRGQARRQPVRLGLRSGGRVEVLEGLQPGDQVVPAAAAGVQAGSRLRAVAAAASAA